MEDITVIKNVLKNIKNPRAQIDEFHNLYNADNILDWCSYCRGGIYIGDTYVSNKKGLYHPGCYEQMNTYFDSLDIEKENGK